MSSRLKTEVYIGVRIPMRLFLNLSEEKISMLFTHNYITLNYDGTESEPPVFLIPNNIKKSLRECNREYVIYRHFIRGLHTTTEKPISVYSSGVDTKYMDEIRKKISKELENLGFTNYKQELLFSLSLNRGYNFN